MHQFIALTVVIALEDLAAIRLQDPGFRHCHLSGGQVAPSSYKTIPIFRKFFIRA